MSTYSNNRHNLNKIFTDVMIPFIQGPAQRKLVIRDVNGTIIDTEKQGDDKILNKSGSKIVDIHNRGVVFFPFVDKEVWDNEPKETIRAFLNNKDGDNVKTPAELYTKVVKPLNEKGLSCLEKIYDDMVTESVAAGSKGGTDKLDTYMTEHANHVGSLVVAARKSIAESLKNEHFAPVFRDYGVNVSEGNALKCLVLLITHTLLLQLNRGNDEYKSAKEGLNWTLKAYLADISAKTADSEKLPIDVPCAVFSESYFDQTLYDKQGNPIFRVSAPNFDEIKNKRILVIGDGGQGKTTFLQRIRDVAGSKEDVRYCRLAGLGKQALDKHDGESVLLKALNVQKEITNNCTLLLDGFNETYKDGAEAAAAIAKEIAKIADKQNTTIIVTSRAGNAAAFPDEFRRFEVHTISGVSAEARDEYCSSHSDFPEKLKPLLGIPMYFNYIKDAEEAPKSQYELLEGIYRRRFMQSDRSACAYAAFYVLVPWVIHKEGSHTVIDGRSLDRAARQLSENPALSEALFYASLELLRNRSVSYSFNDVDIKESYRLLRANGPFSIDAEDNSFVIHESIADYLKSFSELLVLRAIQNCWESDALGALGVLSELSMECGSLSDLSRELMVEQLGLTEDANAAMEQAYATLLQRVRLPADEATILLVHSGFFVMNDFLGVSEETKSATERMLTKFVNDIRGTIENKRLNLDERLRERCETALVDILAKLGEYARGAGDYEKTLELVALAKCISDNDRILAGVLNQEAKVYLNWHRDHCCDKMTLPDGYTKEQLLQTGLDLLTENTNQGYNVSGNLLYLIKARPAPYFVREGMQPDPVDGFWACLQVILNNDKWRRRIGYPLKKGLCLLLTGEVRSIATFASFADLKQALPDDFIRGTNDPIKIDNATWSVVRILLDQLHGEYQGTGYIRGRYALHKGNYDAAKLHFEADLCLQSKIMLNWFFDAGYDLKDAYEALDKDKNDSTKHPLFDPHGKVDKTHPIYTMISALNIELALGGKTTIDIDSLLKKVLPPEERAIVDQMLYRQE